jgi:hypothetical protein
MPSITREVVERVAERVGRGLTLKLALAAEAHPKINVETWKKTIAAHDEFRPIYEAGKGKFLELAMARLAAAEDLRWLTWLLERRHADLFGKPAPAVSVTNNVSVGQSARELSDAELERIIRERGNGTEVTHGTEGCSD